MSNLLLLVFCVTIFFVFTQHGLAIRILTTDIAKQIDGSDESINSSYIPFPRSTHAHRKNKHNKFTEFIVNGIPARKGQFPYQVAVTRKSDMQHLSSGVIISADHVLTSAVDICKSRGERVHKPEELVVHAGMVQLHAKDLMPYEVQDYVCHGQFSPPDNEMHAIALLRVSESFKFSDAVKSVQIAKRNYSAGIDVTISGWGQSTAAAAGNVSEQLLYGDTFTLSPEDCKQRTKDTSGKFFSPATGCTNSYIPSRGPYTHRWDLGTPVVHHDVLIGIVAKNYVDAQVDGYVSVWHHSDWIQRERIQLSQIEINM